MKEQKTRLIVDHNAIYEIDLECMRKKEEKKRKKENRQKMYKKQGFNK